MLEARLRSRIAELREYRRNGIRTFADADVSWAGWGVEPRGAGLLLTFRVKDARHVDRGRGYSHD